MADELISREALLDKAEYDSNFRLVVPVKTIEDAPSVNAVVLPCKVGDTVWAIRNFKGQKHPQRGIVGEMYFTPSMKLQIVVKYVARGEWGKTVFLTREEAEKALKKKKEENPCDHCMSGSYRGCDGCGYGEREENEH